VRKIRQPITPAEAAISPGQPTAATPSKNEMFKRQTARDLSTFVVAGIDRVSALQRRCEAAALSILVTTISLASISCEADASQDARLRMRTESDLAVFRCDLGESRNRAACLGRRHRRAT
jgi:hypothetical protein